MKIRDKVMRRLVIEEATKLRNMITQDEANRLNFSKLDSSDLNKCIYGQLSGSCFNNRATELIKACAARVYKNDSRHMDLRDSKLNGSPIGLSRNEFWSPIEVFIDQEENICSNNKNLVKFIKKEIDELILI